MKTNPRFWTSPKPDAARCGDCRIQLPKPRLRVGFGQAGQISSENRIFLETLEQKILSRKDFAFETTLSGRSYLPRIVESKSRMGGDSCLPLHSECGIFRNAGSATGFTGGHNIPPADIARRYPRNIRNLFDYAEVCDRTLCLDNTQNQIVSIFEKRFG